MFGLVLTAALAPAAPPVDPDPKHLVVPAADLARAAALVEQLGSPRFDEREKAQEDLAALGRKAVPALADALAKHPSAEVRARAQALYPRARADDMQARLAVFVADAACKFEHDLPGWPEFRQITAGGGPGARAVFVELANSPVGRELVLSDLPPHELGARIAARKQEMYARWSTTLTRANQRQEPPAVDVMALMLAETRVPSRHVARSNYTVAVFTFSGFVSVVTGRGPEARVYRTIAGKWVASRDEAMLMGQALSVAGTLDLPEAADVGARMMTTVGVTALSKQSAAAAVVKSGEVRHLPALEAAFKDESVVRPTGVVVAPIGAPAVPAAAKGGVQLRDMALASAILLTQQSPRDFGFTWISAAPSTSSARFLLGNWELRPADRDAAFQKWAAWRAANPDFGQLR